jgi:hypothetical protein
MGVVDLIKWSLIDELLSDGSLGSAIMFDLTPRRNTKGKQSDG